MSGYAGRTQGFKGIHDNIYVRAIVLDDGNTQAALVAWGLLYVTNTAWSEICAVAARVEPMEALRYE